MKTWADALKTQFTVGGEGAGSDPDTYCGVDAQRVRRQAQARHRLSRHLRHHPGDRARRGRRPLRLVVVEHQVDATGLDHGEEAQLPRPHVRTKAPELPHIPLDRATSPTTGRSKSCGSSPAARPWAGRSPRPPGVPADRAQALRRAFDATLKDPAFLAEAEKLKLEVNPVTRRGGRQADRRALRHARRTSSKRRAWRSSLEARHYSR